MNQTELWVDVGGTFTDCILCQPGQLPRTHKLLSSGVTKAGVLEVAWNLCLLENAGRYPANFWRGYRCDILDAAGQSVFQSEVRESTADRLTLADAIPLQVQPGMICELSSGEEAPIVALRQLFGLRLEEPLPAVLLKSGTTRGTNALLTRRGARTALVTTRGFRDVLLIATQDRPRLFDLAIQKPIPLFERVLEVDERLDAEGNVLRSPDAAAIRQGLRELKQQGIESIGICLLHAFTHASHEQLVERLAREAGFTEISVSSALAPLIKIVSRGDTTVMDAYLNPILRAYVGQLQSRLVNGSVKMMTSAGGLVEADRFVGKDSILSGPAGGVIGYSRVAERAGFPRAIGFDMGGTSTDVSRYDGELEREFETRKAGVRVVAPMLAIETVAAGGGSVCAFDGVQLKVGPDSAGAHPGPACYGRGGPLTVTDLNLFLGKVLPAYFPFPLNREIVREKLERLCVEIAGSPLGRQYTPEELADGFLQIANASMVRAIRKISVARGYDPAEYVLVTFGGAGGQHSCPLALALGIPRVLIHPWAGILSAYGMGLADVRRFGECSVLRVYSPELLEELESVFTQLADEATAAVRAEGIDDSRILPPLRSLEMRYKGVEATIQVPQPADGDYLAAYRRQHQQLYGYLHPSREVEVVAARVEIIGQMPEPEETTQPVAERRPEPRETVRTYFQGAWHDTAVYFRADLHAGDRLQSPAIVCEPTSTVVIDPGFSARILERGELLLEAGKHGNQAGERRREGEGERLAVVAPRAADPVLLEIFNNLFASIAEQMGLTLQRTSFSTNVKERLDFSCAIFAPEGDLVVNAPHIPVHLGAMSETVKRIARDNPLIHPGDVFVSNDPYRGGSHLPDVTVVTPVHNPEGELIFWTASRAHHAEIGGIVPGSMPPFSKHLGQEGVLIRNFKLIDRGESREPELRELLLGGEYPTRSVRDNLADVSAQVAANAGGVRLLLELVTDYSLPVVQAYMGFIQQAASEKMRLALRSLADGVYARTDHLDDGSPIAVQITIQGETATVDFTGTGPVLSSNLNANRAIVTAATLYVFRCMIQEDIPLNSGVLEPVTLILPECLLNPPEHDNPAECAAMVGGNVETSQRVVDTLLGALELAAASQGTMNNLTFGNQNFGYYETICGGSGATASADGADAVHTHMTNTRLTDAEVLERRYPVRVREFSIRAGSGGAGTHRGGDGIIRELEFLETVQVSLLTERRGQYPPFGLRGGEPGKTGRNLLRRAGQADWEDLGGKMSITVQAGDVLRIETPGGGGFGPPQGPYFPVVRREAGAYDQDSPSGKD